MQPRDRLFKIAGALRRCEGLDKSEALRQAWVAVRLIQRLQAGEAHFIYVKSTGEIRRAHGTLVGPDGQIWDGFHESRPDRVSYWDLDRYEWRSAMAHRIFEGLQLELDLA